MAKKATGKEVARIIEEGIEHKGNKLILPLDPYLTCRQGAEALLEKAQQEEQTVYAHELIEGNPFDGLAAFHAVLKQMFGWSTTKATPTFFGPRPPAMMDIRTGPNPADVIQVPVGLISAPGLDFSFQVEPTEHGLALYAELKQYQAKKVSEIAANIRVYLRDHSIYKGKAFRMPKRWDMQPEFVSFDHVQESELVLNKPVAHSVLVNLLTPIRRADEVKASKVPLKRSILLRGDYGTGKSMTIAITAKAALECKWTVIYLDDTSRLADALENARRWQPCLLVAEDLDRIAQTRDDKLNQLINTLSGALSENADVMVVMTTNHAEKIERVVLRRVQMITFERPNAESVERIIRLYGRGVLAVNGGLSTVSAKLAGQIPSTIKAVVEQAHLARIALNKDVIDEESLIVAADAMGPQIELLNSEKVESEPTIDRALRDLVEHVALRAAVEALARQTEAPGIWNRAREAETLRKTVN